MDIKIEYEKTPIKHVTLILDKEDAYKLFVLVCQIVGSGDIRNFTDDIYHRLKELDSEFFNHNDEKFKEMVAYNREHDLTFVWR